MYEIACPNLRHLHRFFSKKGKESKLKSQMINLNVFMKKLLRNQNAVLSFQVTLCSFFLVKFDDARKWCLNWARSKMLLVSLPVPVDFYWTESVFVTSHYLKCLGGGLEDIGKYLPTFCFLKVSGKKVLIMHLVTAEIHFKTLKVSQIDVFAQLRRVSGKILLFCSSAFFVAGFRLNCAFKVFKLALKVMFNS